MSPGELGELEPIMSFLQGSNEEDKAYMFLAGRTGMGDMKLDSPMT